MQVFENLQDSPQQDNAAAAVAPLVLPAVDKNLVDAVRKAIEDYSLNDYELFIRMFAHEEKGDNKWSRWAEIWSRTGKSPEWSFSRQRSAAALSTEPDGDAPSSSSREEAEFWNELLHG